MSRRKQPQRLPPPITQGEEPIEFTVVLKENQGELAALLWKTLRSVRLWTEAGEALRTKLFESGAATARSDRISAAIDVPSELIEPLTRASSVLAPRARSAVVARACADIADWASETGRPGTAIDFMQAAALALPSDPDFAQQVAILARNAAQYHRAETWYRQAISRARRAQSWNAFARSYIGLGIVFTLRGNYPQAHRSLIRGLRASRRFSIRPLVAAAAHELVVVGIRTDRAEDVTRFGKIAVSAYGANHPRLPALSHDLGIYLLNAGFFDAALRIIQATPADFGTPADQLVRWSAMARVAAALGMRGTYGHASVRAELLLEDPAAFTVSTEARLALATGADLMGETDRALRYLDIVRKQALRRGEAQLGFAAESLLESIRNRQAARLNASPVLTSTPRPLAGLVEDLESAMNALRTTSK